jgi:predicted O-methyltransferase YrrM
MQNIKLFKATRWQNINSLQDEWVKRIRALRDMLPSDTKSLVDFGCGKKVLKQFLSPDILYIGIDSHRKFGADRELDLNSKFTTEDLPKADVAFFSGVLEYIANLPYVLEKISYNFSTIVFSYHTFTQKSSSRGSRRNLGWVNDFTLSELASCLESNDFTITRYEEFFEDTRLSQPQFIASARHILHSPRERYITLLRQVFSYGKMMDLTGACYGPASWTVGKFITTTSPYYFFLSGLCKFLNFSKVIEVGTHYGGSTLAMLRGIQDQTDHKIVTIDVTNLNEEILNALPAIARIQGSGSSPEIQTKAVAAIGSRHCDLLYIDALKDKQFVLDTINGFLEKISVGIIILDDISISESMREMWEYISSQFGKYAFNVSEIDSDIRSPKVGFGVIFIKPLSDYKITN